MSPVCAVSDVRERDINHMHRPVRLLTPPGKNRGHAGGRRNIMWGGAHAGGADAFYFGINQDQPYYDTQTVQIMQQYVPRATR